MKRAKKKERGIGYMNSVKKSLMTLCISMVLIVSVVIGGVAILGISNTTMLALTNYKNAMNSGYNEEIKTQVQSVITILQTEYDKYVSGVLTEEEAKKEACDIIRNIRYADDASGYFWIDATDYTLVMHPILAEQEGNNRKNLADQNGVMIVQEILKVANSSARGGYNEFYFTKSDGITVAPKIAYSQLFEPWGWVVSTGNYVDDMQEEMKEVKEEIGNKYVELCVEIIVIAIVMTVLSSLLSWRYGRKVCRSLGKITSLASRISEGDLTTPIDVRDKSELGRTAIALNTAQQHIVTLITGISQTSKELEYAVESFTQNFNTMEKSIANVSVAVNEIAENTVTQASSTSEASSSIGEIADGIEETSREVISLDGNSKAMKEYSDKSMEALKKLIEVNTKTKADIDAMYAQTEDTNASVQKISQAATFISDIASQTNLLSLNASIEAARAGEAGRGFAVVAEEIGKLATQSSDSATDITQLIKELTDNSEKSVKIMENMNQAAQLQVETLESTSEMFEALNKALISCVSSVGLITERIEYINMQRERMTTNIDVLNESATDNASSTEETSAMAMELDNAVRDSGKIVQEVRLHTNTLVENASQFKL